MFFLYVFAFFFEWFLGRNDLTFLDEGDFDAKETIHHIHLKRLHGQIM